MTRARSRRTARRKIKRLIRKTLKIVCAVWDFIARHPAMLAMPLIIFLLVLTIQMHEFEKQVQAWDQEIRQQQEQIEELYDRQDPVEQTDMTDVYGCKSLYGTYDFPWNTMSQDWGSDQVTGFYYHEISEECKAAGGELPTIIQVYTYIVCEQNGVDYEMVFALIEQESRCRWDAEGDNGTSIGLMQVSEKWHMQRMEELGAYDLKNPYQNVLVGVNYLSEIQNDLRGTVYTGSLQLREAGRKSESVGSGRCEVYIQHEDYGSSAAAEGREKESRGGMRMIRNITKKIRHMIRMIMIRQCHHCCLFCKYWNICKEEEE